jgi:SAM-dependent methyltransferase
MEPLFDLSQEYDSMLNKGIKLSGEDKFYFIKGRLNEIKTVLPKNFAPEKILDFGCGIGDTSNYLSQLFPSAKITGVDIAQEALKYAAQKYNKPNLIFKPLSELPLHQNFDLCYVNGVFHHINTDKRAEALSLIYQSLKPKGYFAFCENNPLNPATKMVMKRIPFDKDAVLIKHRSARVMLKEVGFSKLFETRFLFYFPKMLGFLRFTEKALKKIPLGAQYIIVAQK